MNLIVKDLQFGYNSRTILNGISLELRPKEMLGVIGPNGSGKSTLIQCIDGLLRPETGSILLDGKELKDISRKELARKVGYVPQTTSRSFFPSTVIDTVLMGKRPHLGWRSSNKDVKNVIQVLRLIGIEDLAMRDINELSGGQQQKVLIARALAQEPAMLLLDEPTSNLDIKHQLEVVEIIREKVMEKSISAIMAVHDLNLAAKYTDRIVMMKDGKVFATGTPESVLTTENIRAVYGVVAEVIKNNGNSPHIVPVRSLRRPGQPLASSLLSEPARA
ncbi:MAG TPA: ABC transporter ATP-binding protein [Methanothrix sp.]|nr:ABC transporter ATP-binding protein [Methanothrix sp.]HPT37745.1 ABC transporter ATP-binding protein [Methanothrix sp.]